MSKETDVRKHSRNKPKGGRTRVRKHKRSIAPILMKNYRNTTYEEFYREHKEFLNSQNKATLTRYNEEIDRLDRIQRNRYPTGFPESATRSYPMRDYTHRRKKILQLKENRQNYVADLSISNYATWKYGFDALTGKGIAKKKIKQELLLDLRTDPKIFNLIEKRTSTLDTTKFFNERRKRASKYTTAQIHKTIDEDISSYKKRHPNARIVVETAIGDKMDAVTFKLQEKRYVGDRPVAVRYTTELWNLHYMLKHL